MIPNPQPKKIHIVLFNPEIPQNTGNISRTCAVTGASLHIVKPIGFEISDRTLKRAGLDYWDKLDVHIYENLEDFFKKNADATLWYFSAKGNRSFAEVAYPETVYLAFGCESAGLPEEMLLADPSHTLRIPMLRDCRCLNLSNSVAVAVYEVLRQDSYRGLTVGGEFGEK